MSRPNANPGCESGNCLRSHVNKTETHGALSMITKAGVPASKVMVGISSYGRSFGMKGPNCTEPTCKFTGSFTESTAEPGLCTLTGGYIANAELNQIVDYADEEIPGYQVCQWYDEDSDWQSTNSKGSGPCTDAHLKPISSVHTGPQFIRYKMRDEDGFYKALPAQYGISKDWIQWKMEINHVQSCTCPQIGDCPQCTATDSLTFYNYPQRIDDTDKINVPNPKNLVEKAVPNTDDLADVMLSTYMQMRLGSLDADDTDVVTVFSIPDFMLESASKQIE